MALPKGLGSITDMLKRIGNAVECWELWRPLHQESMEFATPNRETFTLFSPGQKKNRHIFDSTAILGTQQFANRIQGSLIPSWQQWMEFSAGDEIPEEDKDRVDGLLEDATDTFFSNLNHSNFSTEISPSLVDLAIGTGAIIIEEGDFEKGEALRFTNVPLAELYPEKPPGGAIETVFRKQKIKPTYIERLWPGAKLNNQLESAKKNAPHKEIQLWNCFIFNPEDGKYWQVVIHEPSKHVVFTQSFKSKRLIVFRWHVTPGEVFGRGPIIQMLPDIRTVNKVKEFTLNNAAIQMAGVYTGRDDGVWNPHTFRIAPGVVNAVSTNDTRNPSLAALPRAGDIGLGNFILADLQNDIRKALFADPLGEITDPVRSATEQLIRQQESLKDSGASFGRLKSELVEPIVAAVVDILSGLGKMAPIVVDGREVTIKQTSPLAKAEGIEDFQNTQLWLSTLAGFLPPEVIATSVKVEEIPKSFQEDLGVDASLVRTEDEREQFVAEAQAAAQAQGEPVG